MASSFSKSKLIWSLLFECEGVWPTAVALLDDGRKLAAADRTGAIYLWDITGDPPAPDDKAKKDSDGAAGADRPPYRKLVGHTNAVTRMLALPDGRTLVSVGLDKTVRLWDTQAPATGSAEVILDAERRKREAKRNKDAPVPPKLKVETSEPSATLEAHGEWINALAVSGDGKRLITGDDSAIVIVWDITAKKPIARWRGRPGGWITSVALDDQGTAAFVGEFCSSRGDFDRPPPELRLFDVSDGADNVQVPADATASMAVKLDILAVQTPKVKKRDNSYEYYSAWTKFVARGIVAAVFSPKGDVIALAQGGETDTGKVHLIHLKTGELVKSISGHQYGATDVLFDATGDHILSSGRDTMVRIVSVADGKDVAALGKPRGGQFKDWITAIALSKDQRTLAATDMAGLVHIWRFE